MSELTDSLASLEVLAATLPSESAAFNALSDDDLVAVPAALARVQHRLEATAAIAAGMIAKRSRIDLGYTGLAQRSGYRTPAGLIQKVTGDSNRHVSKLVRVGVMIQQADEARTAATAPVDPNNPGATERFGRSWLARVAAAVAAAEISLDAAEAIRVGLGEPSETVTETALAGAASDLVNAAADLDVDALAIRARTAREDLDEAGIADREAERWRRRSLRVFRQSDGMTRLVWLLDPESAATVTATYDQLTSPRRGGPRLIAEAEKSRAEAITSDSRTTEQLAHDGFLQLLTIAGSVAPTTLIGTHRPAVRVLVTETSLKENTGHGRLEGQLDAVSIATIQRHLCDTGILPISFDDDGQCMNVGREQRLFTRRQRIALVARDGGCLWTGCDRPASWSEAHHIDEWSKDHGKTNVEDGVLLCRYHHLLLHNNHWRIRRTNTDYWLIPPLGQDPDQAPIPLPSKSAALKDLLRERERRTG
jgi:hypothetical protein